MAKSMIPLGCSTLGFRHDPLDVALSEIAAQGFHLVDIAMYPSYCPHFNPQTATAAETSALEMLLDQHGLNVATINATDGLLGNPEQREQALAYAGACLDLARRETKEHLFLRGPGTRQRSIPGRSSLKKNSSRTVSGTSSIETTSGCSSSTGKVSASQI